MKQTICTTIITHEVLYPRRFASIFFQSLGGLTGIIQRTGEGRKARGESATVSHSEMVILPQNTRYFV